MYPQYLVCWTSFPLKPLNWISSAFFFSEDVENCLANRGLNGLWILFLNTSFVVMKPTLYEWRALKLIVPVSFFLPSNCIGLEPVIHLYLGKRCSAPQCGTKDCWKSLPVLPHSTYWGSEGKYVQKCWQTVNYVLQELHSYTRDRIQSKHTTEEWKDKGLAQGPNIGFL